MSTTNFGLTCSKFVLIVFNTLFILLGAAGCAVGLWILFDKSLGMTQLVQTDDQSPNCKSAGLIETAGHILVVAGAIIILVGLLGFLGMYWKKRWILYIFCGCLVFIFCLELVTIITASVFEKKIEMKLHSLLKSGINSTYDGKIPSHNRFTATINYAQIYFECCGVDSYDNFYGSDDWSRATTSGDLMMIPPTCCKMSNRKEFLQDGVRPQLVDVTCPLHPSLENSNKDTPCWRSLVEYFMEKISIVIGLSVAVIAPEVLCIISAFCVIHDTPKSKTSQIVL